MNYDYKQREYGGFGKEFHFSGHMEVANSAKRVVAYKITWPETEDFEFETEWVYGARTEWGEEFWDDLNWVEMPAPSSGELHVFLYFGRGEGDYVHIPEYNVFEEIELVEPTLLTHMYHRFWMYLNNCTLTFLNFDEISKFGLVVEGDWYDSDGAHISPLGGDNTYSIAVGKDCEFVVPEGGSGGLPPIYAPTQPKNFVDDSFYDNIPQQGYFARSLLHKYKLVRDEHTGEPTFSNYIPKYELNEDADAKLELIRGTWTEAFQFVQPARFPTFLDSFTQGGYIHCDHEVPTSNNQAVEELLELVVDRYSWGTSAYYNNIGGGESEILHYGNYGHKLWFPGSGLVSPPDAYMHTDSPWWKLLDGTYFNMSGDSPVFLGIGKAVELDRRRSITGVSSPEELAVFGFSLDGYGRHEVLNSWVFYETEESVLPEFEVVYLTLQNEDICEHEVRIYANWEFIDDTDFMQAELVETITYFAPTGQDVVFNFSPALGWISILSEYGVELKEEDLIFVDGVKKAKYYEYKVAAKRFGWSIPEIPREAWGDMHPQDHSLRIYPNRTVSEANYPREITWDNIDKFRLTRNYGPDEVEEVGFDISYISRVRSGFVSYTPNMIEHNEFNFADWAQTSDEWNQSPPEVGQGTELYLKTPMQVTSLRTSSPYYAVVDTGTVTEAKMKFVPEYAGNAYITMDGINLGSYYSLNALSPSGQSTSYSGNVRVGVGNQTIQIYPVSNGIPLNPEEVTGTDMTLTEWELPATTVVFANPIEEDQLINQKLPHTYYVKADGECKAINMEINVGVGGAVSIFDNAQITHGTAAENYITLEGFSSRAEGFYPPTGIGDLVTLSGPSNPFKSDADCPPETGPWIRIPPDRSQLVFWATGSARIPREYPVDRPLFQSELQELKNDAVDESLGVFTVTQQTACVFNEVTQEWETIIRDHDFFRRLHTRRILGGFNSTKLEDETELELKKCFGPQENTIPPVFAIHPGISQTMPPNLLSLQQDYLRNYVFYPRATFAEIRKVRTGYTHWRRWSEEVGAYVNDYKYLDVFGNKETLANNYPFLT